MSAETCAYVDELDGPCVLRRGHHGYHAYAARAAAPPVERSLPLVNPSLMGSIEKGAKDRPPFTIYAAAPPVEPEKRDWSEWNRLPQPDGMYVYDPDGFRFGKPTVVTYEEFLAARMECTLMHGDPLARAVPPSPDRAGLREAIEDAIAILDHTSDHHATDARLTLLAALHREAGT